MDEKEDKKTGQTAEEFFLIIFVVILAVAALMRAIAFFSPNGNGQSASSPYLESLTGGPNGWYNNTLHFISVGVSAYVTIATIFSIVTFLAILYVAWLTHQLKVEEKKKSKQAPAIEKSESMETQKWQKVMAHANSQNPAEWRLSILEADVMLDELVQSKGFHGETLGERLKNTSKADFKTLDAAWEANKIRNAIAHEGSDFLLSQRESKRVIGLYETVFKEFAYI